MVAIPASATALAAMALAALNETIVISGFGYRGNSPQDRIFFTLSVDNVSCDVSGNEVPGIGYACSDSGFTFDVLSQTGSKLRLHHIIDGVELSGDFAIRMNGPLPTILDQVGTSTAVLTTV